MNTSTENSTSVTDLNALRSTIYQAACSVNFILSFPTNGYILWLIITGAGETMTTDFFTLNLCVSENLFCFFSVFFIVSQIYQKYPLQILGQFGFGLLFYGRPLFQNCICVERYLAVVHPVTFLKYKPLRYRVGCCSAVWLFVLGACLLRSMLMAKIQYFTLGLHLILMSVLLFCCLSVLWALKQSGPGNSEREGANNMKMRAFKIILIIFLSMLVSYLPLIIMMCFSTVNGNTKPIIMSNVVISGVVQPLVFLHRAGKLTFIKGL